MIDRLPYGWEIVQIGQVADFINGYSQFNSKSYVDNGIPIFRIGDLGGQVDLSGVKRVSKDVVPNLNQKRLFRGDILIAKIGKRVGASSVYNFDEPAILSSQVAGVRAKRIEQKFLACFIESPFFYDAIKPHFFGSTRDNISPNQIRLTSIPFPPLPTQRKIGAVLGTYDDLIENNTRRIKILEEMAGTIYREWFVEFRFPGHEQVKMVESELGLIPQGWEIRLINELIDFKSGYAFRSKTFVDQGDYNVVTIKNVKDGAFLPVCDNRIGNLPSNLPDHCHLKNGDILLSLTGYVGRVCLAYGKNYLLNQRVAKLAPKNPEHYPFVYIMFRQRDLQLRLEAIATGVAQQNLSPIKAGRLVCISPGPKLLTQFSNLVKPYIDQILNLNQKNANLRQTRDLLLPKLISGELDVSELDIDTDGIQPKARGDSNPVSVDRAVAH